MFKIHAMELPKRNLVSLSNKREKKKRNVLYRTRLTNAYQSETDILGRPDYTNVMLYINYYPRQKIHVRVNSRTILVFELFSLIFIILKRVIFSANLLSTPSGFCDRCLRERLSPILLQQPCTYLPYHIAYIILRVIFIKILLRVVEASVVPQTHKIRPVSLQEFY